MQLLLFSVKDFDVYAWVATAGVDSVRLKHGMEDIHNTGTEHW